MIDISFGSPVMISDSLIYCVFIATRSQPIDAISGEKFPDIFDRKGIYDILWTAKRTKQMIGSPEFHRNGSFGAKTDAASNAAYIDCIYKALSSVNQIQSEIFYEKMLNQHLSYTDSEWEQYKKDISWMLDALKQIWGDGSFMKSPDAFSNPKIYSINRLNDKAIKAGIIT